jgi:peptidyl-prolyl cis-trans isomerase C
VRIVCLVVFLLSANCAQAADETTPVAFVNGSPITFLQVKRTLVGAVGGRPVSVDILPALQAQALEQTILKKLMLARLKELQYQPTADELRLAEENFELNLALRKLTREEYLKQNSLSGQDLDDLRYWEICWNRFVREQLTDERLHQFFDAHHRDFDGTQLRVSHILRRLEGRREQADLNTALAEMRALREDLVAGKTTFAAAAAKFSSGPSREQGGDLGYIGRREPMGDEFSAAAFKLAKGEISPPVVTPFGVHLITVTDERPGTTPWTAVREQLLPAAENDFFRRTAGELRKSADVKYTDLVPHLDPATGKIVVPAKAATPAQQ